MLHTSIPTGTTPVSASETVMLGDSANERRFDCCPHEYFDSYCDERGRTTGARMRQNFSFSEIERQRSIGCERPGAHAYSTEMRQYENRRGQGNGERSIQNHSDLLVI